MSLQKFHQLGSSWTAKIVVEALDRLLGATCSSCSHCPKLRLMGSTSPSLNVPAGNQNTKSRISKSPLAAQAPKVAEDAHREVQWSPHHVRPDFRHPEASNLDGLAEARKEVANLKSRGVTRFVDMKRANKRNVEEIQSDEEELPDAGPPRQRPRLDPTPRPGNLIMIWMRTLIRSQEMMAFSQCHTHQPLWLTLLWPFPLLKLRLIPCYHLQLYLDFLKNGLWWVPN